MMFVSDKFWLLLATTHIPLARSAASWTGKN